jgi:hypothetical protein
LRQITGSLLLLQTPVVFFVKYHLTFLYFFAILLIGRTGQHTTWLTKDNRAFTIHYTNEDSALVADYEALAFAGIQKTESFFGERYKNKFDVFIYPHRKFLDSAWENDWKIPGFTSECWMVASGIGSKIDILSPARWTSESCGHSYIDRLQTLQLITHELVHVFHGQRNVSPDFSDVKNMDWFVEGLAAYASGQCDTARIADVVKAIKASAVPSSVDQFWTGNLKYGLSGTLVMYIDKKYGRDKLNQLIPYNRGQKIFEALAISEPQLRSGWKQFMLSLAK